MSCGHALYQPTTTAISSRSYLKQGTKSVEEYYKEMDIAMIRANVTEDDEQTMACFLNGLNHPINKIADSQPYSNLIELVHQATKTERQVQDDFKYAKFSSKSYGLSNNQASTTPTTSNGDKSSYKKASTSSSRPPTTSNFKPKASSSSTPSVRPSRQVPSNVSHAEAEATSPSSAQTSAP